MHWANSSMASSGFEEASGEAEATAAASGLARLATPSLVPAPVEQAAKASGRTTTAARRLEASAAGSDHRSGLLYAGEPLPDRSWTQHRTRL